MQSTEPHWILVANASRARLLQYEEGERIAVLASFKHTQSRRYSSEPWARLGSGHSFDPRAYSAQVGPQKEQPQFARELADTLEEGARQGRCARIHVFAANPFLKQINAQLGEVTRRLLAGTYNLDLSVVGPAEIDTRIHDALEQVERWRMHA